MTDRGLIWLAVVFYAASSLLTVWRLRGRGPVPGLSRLNHVLLACGLVLHTAFLYWRGHVLGRCPVTNLFEVQVFVAWAAVLFYFLVGHSYRVSFLGAFTAPLVLAICLAGLLAPIDAVRAEPLRRSAWVEFHAAIAILAFGAFALAFVASGMYLRQESQLKTHHLGSSFLLLPAIEQLEVINFRLLLLGFAMLTVGMIGGVISDRLVGHWTVPKTIWAVAIWIVYAALLAAQRLWSLRGRRIAALSMLAFGVTLGSFWVASLLSNPARPAP